MNKLKLVVDEFLSFHKNSELSEWLPNIRSDYCKYKEIYSSLERGAYGDVDDDGENKTIEISSCDSVTGRPILFSWVAL